MGLRISRTIAGAVEDGQLGMSGTMESFADSFTTMDTSLASEYQDCARADAATRSALPVAVGLHQDHSQ